MNATQCQKNSTKVITLAVQAALLTMFGVPLVAYADDKPKVDEQPPSPYAMRTHFISPEI